jgi:hypothetical protein
MNYSANKMAAKHCLSTQCIVVDIVPLMSSAKFYIIVSISAKSNYKNMKINTLILLSLVRIKYIIRRKVGEL